MEATIMQKRSLNTGCGLGRPGANPTTSEFTTMFNAGIEVGKSFFLKSRIIYFCFQNELGYL
jgi:hypothetical protein